METKQIEISTVINAAIAEVWAKYTNPKDVVKWNQASEDWHTPKATNDLRVGGEFRYTMAAKDGSMSFDFWGVYTALEINKHIAYTMGDGRKATVDFAELPQGVQITVQFDPEGQNTPERQRAGWQSILDSFKKYVEGN